MEDINFVVHKQYDSVPMHKSDLIMCGVSIGSKTNTLPQKISKMALCVVLDISNSMDGTKLLAARGAIHHILARMDDSCLISIITFNDEARMVTNDFSRCNDPELSSKIDEIIATGMTNMGDAIIMGCTQILNLAPIIPVEMLILTDGVSNRGPNIVTILEFIHGLSRPFPINTCTIGDDFDATLLQRISTITSGIYFHIPDESNMAEKIGELISAMKSISAFDMKLTMRAKNGCRIANVFGAWFENPLNAKLNVVHLGNLYKKRSFLIVFNVRKNIGHTPHSLCDLTLEYSSLIGAGAVKYQNIEIDRGTEYAGHCDDELCCLQIRYIISKTLDKFGILLDQEKYAEADILIDEAIKCINLYAEYQSQEVITHYNDAINQFERMKNSLQMPSESKNSMMARKSQYSTGRGGAYVSGDELTEGLIAKEEIDKYVSFHT